MKCQANLIRSKGACKQEVFSIKKNTMKNITIIYLTILYLFSFYLNAQQAKVVNTEKKTDNYTYIDRLKTYERISDKGYNSVEVLKKVGDSYFYEDEFDKAEECYAKLFGLTSELEPQYYYRYSIALRARGKTEQAEQYLKRYNEISTGLQSK